MKRRPKIGIILPCDFEGFPPGGMQPTVKIFLKYARECSYDISLFGATTSEDEPVGKMSRRTIYGVDYPFLPIFRLRKVENRRPLIPVRVRAVFAYLRFRRLIQSLGFDLMYLHEPSAFPLFPWRRYPILYHIHAPQEADARYSRYAIFRRGPLFWVYMRLVRYLMHSADRFIIIDDESMARCLELAPERRDRFHFVPTAIDVDAFRPLPGFDRAAARRRWGLPASDKMVFFAGRLSWKKGVDLVLRSFAQVVRQVPDSFLAIAGLGEDRLALEDLTAQLGLREKVFFLGSVRHLPDPDLPELYNCANVSVVASFHESLALVITEALACGVPVVSTHVGIAPKVIRNGETGYIVERRDPDEMAGRILSVLRSQAVPCERCVAAARDYGETSKEICAVLDSMLAERDSLRATGADR